MITLKSQFFTLAQISHKMCQIIMYPEHLLYAGSAQDSDLAYFWGNLSQSEKLSENKLPLDYQRKVLNQTISTYVNFQKSLVFRYYLVRHHFLHKKNTFKKLCIINIHRKLPWGRQKLKVRKRVFSIQPHPQHLPFTKTKITLLFC